MSARRNPVQVSSTAFNRITRLDLGWHPYRMHVRHELLPNDYLRRLRFGSVVQPEMRRRPSFFGSCGNWRVNSHNVRRYAPKGHPPEFNFNRSDSRAKLTVWAGLCGNGVILGPYFFEGNVDGVAYLQMLHEYVLQLLAVHFRDHFENGLFRDLWWAQDGAPAHRLLEVRDRLNGVFGNERVIGLGHNVEWPPRSPDLTPCDFFLWGYLKGKVFSSPPHDVNILRQRIIAEFNALRNNPNFITNAVRHIQKRTTLCVQRNGGHVQGHGA